MDFTNGGGSNYYGGAVDSGATTTVRGGTFRDNRNDEYGGVYDQDLDPSR
jgi:hypothetical protein